MEETKFFEQMLGLSKPWRVEAVELQMEEKRVVVRLGVESGTQWAEGGELLPIHGYEQRQWRHLDTMQFETVLEARVPRVRRVKGEGGGEPAGVVTEMVRVPWAEPGSRWTLLFEAWAVKVLQASESVHAASLLLQLDWHSAHAVMQRAVERGLRRRDTEAVEAVGLDEKSFGRGQSYVTLCTDLTAGRVLEVVPERTTEAARAALRVLPPEQRERVKAACIDMSAAYDAALACELPGATRVYDRFHVAKLLGEAVDAVRRQEHKALGKAGDSPLTGARYLFLSNMNRLNDERFDRLEALLQADLKTGKAYAYRIHFQEFWECAHRDHGAAFFANWYRSAIRTRLRPIKQVARTLKDHLDGLLNYFSHRITNAVTEGLNSMVQKLKANARGFRSFTHYRTRILFFLGRLNLLPQTH